MYNVCVCIYILGGGGRGGENYIYIQEKQKKKIRCKASLRVVWYKDYPGRHRMYVGFKFKSELKEPVLFSIKMCHP